MVVRVIELAPLPPVVLSRIGARRLDGAGAGTLYEINAGGLALLRASPELQSIEVISAPPPAAASPFAAAAVPLPLRRLTIDLGAGEADPRATSTPGAILSSDTAIPGMTLRAGRIDGNLTAAEPGLIAFQIEDDTTTVLQAGTVADPRYIRGELADGSGRLIRRIDAWQGTAPLTLDIPDMPGAVILRLRIYDRAGGGDAVRARDSVLRIK